MRSLLLDENGTSIWDRIITWSTTTGLEILRKLLIALLFWWISFKIINLIFRRMEKRLANKEIDRTVKEVTITFSRRALKLLVIIAIIGYLGLEMSSIVALITSIGVTIGLALQGSLSNLAGGIIILIMRPFKLGDYVEYEGVNGTVDKIDLFYTTLVTPDNKVIVVPNSKVSSCTITNYSIKKIRRVDITFSIAYENDFRKAKRIITKVIENHELVLKDKEPTIRIVAHNTSSIDIVCRVWVKSSDYWEVKFDLLEQVKLAFDKNGISIPYNQLDVHIKDDNNAPKPIDLDDELVQEEIAIEEKINQQKHDKRVKQEEDLKHEQETKNKKVSTKIKKIISVKSDKTK